MNEVKLTHLTWKDIDDSCKKLVNLIKNSGFKPEIIVGIQRGGCITAVLLSHLLNIEDFCTIGIRSTESDDVHVQRMQPVVYDSFSLQLINGKKVLLADDINDTGGTLVEAKIELLKYDCREVKSATIVSNPANIDKVDFYAKEIEPWVVFPWETKI